MATRQDIVARLAAICLVWTDKAQLWACCSRLLLWIVAWVPYPPYPCRTWCITTIVRSWLTSRVVLCITCYRWTHNPYRTPHLINSSRQRQRTRWVLRTTLQCKQPALSSRVVTQVLSRGSRPTQKVRGKACHLRANWVRHLSRFRPSKNSVSRSLESLIFWWIQNRVGPISQSPNQ